MAYTFRGPRGVAFTDYRKNPISARETEIYDEEDDVSFLESNDRATPIRQVRARFTETDTDFSRFISTRIYRRGDTHRIVTKEYHHMHRRKLLRRRIVHFYHRIRMCKIF